MSSNRSSGSFFRTVLAVVVGLFAFSFVAGLFFLVFVGIAMNSLSSIEIGNKKISGSVEKGSILHLKLKGRLSELGMMDGSEEIWGAFEALLQNKKTKVSSSAPGLLGIAHAIREAKTDPLIEGISMEIDALKTGLAPLEELYGAIQDFKSSGKFVYAYSESLKEPHQLITSLADTLMMYPYSLVEFDGFVIQMGFYRGMLELLGLQPRAFRRGKYKSAAESLTNKQISEPTREQYTLLLSGLYNNYLKHVAQAKEVPQDSLQKIATELSVWHSEQAKNKGLITHLGYKDNYDALLRNRLQLKEKQKIPLVSIAQYKKHLKASSSQSNEPRIAVIISEGVIYETDQESSAEESIRPHTFTSMLHQAAQDKEVEAIVIRINSPGGSFTASDKIWHEIKKVAQEKPVIASMGQVAASGGYYMAMACDRIIAYPSTITGSIGVISIIFEMKELLKKIEVGEDQILSAPYANTSVYNSTLTPMQERIFEESIDHIYQIFLEKAADGRPLNVDQVHELAQGRVWTGEDAQKQALIDETGLFHAAIEAAAQAADLESSYQIQYMYARDPAQLITFILNNTSLPRQWTSEWIIPWIWPQELQEASDILKQGLEDPLSMQHIQARMPYLLDIH